MITHLVMRRSNKNKVTFLVNEISRILVFFTAIKNFKFSLKLSIFFRKESRIFALEIITSPNVSFLLTGCYFLRRQKPSKIS